MKNIVILGSTGSVGRNCLKVVRKFKNKLCIKALCVNNNIDLLEKQIEEFSPKVVCVYNETKAKELQERQNKVKVLSGIDGLCEIASLSSVDVVLAAMSGIKGLKPIIEAIEAKKTIAIANKEILVSAGEFVTNLSKKTGSQLIPVDSEHSAVFQCLLGENKKNIKKIILTASGGPFFNFSIEKLKKVTVEDALSHPTYSMGKKISIDSSTLMNKGLEVIEAFWLFGVSLDKIEVIVHKESLVHSFVEFIDGSMLAQISKPDMKYPIQYALFYPERQEQKDSFDFDKFSKFSFYKVDNSKFSCLSLAYKALEMGKSASCYLNGANEILVERFLQGEISWFDISKKLEKLISSYIVEDMLSLEDILRVDKKARIDAQKI